jgi:hypothetical protein
MSVLKLMNFFASPLLSLKKASASFWSAIGSVRVWLTFGVWLAFIFISSFVSASALNRQGEDKKWEGVVAYPERYISQV